MTGRRGEPRSGVPRSGTLVVASTAGRRVLAAAVLASAMASIDATVVGVALPAIGRDFGSSFSALQWVVNGYTLTLGALLLLGGSLGDRIGRRRVLCAGVVVFAVSSAACAAAPSPIVLVLTRVFQGVGAALLTPGSLAILEASFSRDERGGAIGRWTALGGVATAAGPLLGGYLVATASWRWIFLVNLPVAVGVLFLALRYVPESRDPQAASRHIDLPGAVLGVAALAGISFGLIGGPGSGWSSPVALIALVGGAVAAVLFVWIEWRSRAPMLPLALFSRRDFAVTNAVTLLVYAALGGTLFLLPVELQVVGHYSALESGAALLPVTALMLVLSGPSGRLAARLGPRLQMSAGPVVVAAGLALLARAGSDHGYLTGVLPGVAVFGLGLAMTVAPLTVTALGSAPDDQAGVASAVNNDAARVAGLLAVAVLPALAGIVGADWKHAPELASGFQTAALIAASWCVAGGVLAAIGLPRRHRDQRSLETGRVHCGLDATPLCGDLPAEARRA